MTELEYIRLYHPEAKADDDELKKWIDRATKEVKNCYQDMVQARALYALYLKKQSDDLVCAEGDLDTAFVASEKITGNVQTNFEKVAINGVIPVNYYHKLFLELHTCRVKSSVWGAFEDSTCNNGRYYNTTDIENHFANSENIFDR